MMHRVYMAVAACCAVVLTVLTAPAPAHAAPAKATIWLWAGGYIHASEAPNFCLDNNFKPANAVVQVKPCRIDWIAQYWFVCIKQGGVGWISPSPAYILYHTERLGQVGISLDNRAKIINPQKSRNWRLIIFPEPAKNAYVLINSSFKFWVLSVPPPNRLSNRGTTVTWNKGGSAGFKPKSQVWDLPRLARAEGDNVCINSF